MTFRISEDGRKIRTLRLRLDGVLSGEGVEILERLCRAALKRDRRAVLDFARVTFITESGVRLLRRLDPAQVQIINCSAFICALMKERE